MRKVPQPLPPLQVRAIIVDMGTWRVVEPRSGDLLAAVAGMVRWRISFWDAMILIAAIRADAEMVWSEDLNDGQRYDGVVVRNPFT